MSHSRKIGKKCVRSHVDFHLLTRAHANWIDDWIVEKLPFTSSICYKSELEKITTIHYLSAICRRCCWHSKTQLANIIYMLRVRVCVLGVHTSSNFYVLFSSTTIRRWWWCWWWWCKFYKAEEYRSKKWQAILHVCVDFAKYNKEVAK